MPKDTAGKQRNAAENSTDKPKKKVMPKGVPFRKNDPTTGEIDKRINRDGVRKFDEVRHVALRLFNEKIQVGSEGKKAAMTQLEFVLRDWILSRDFQKQARALEYGVGKVPDEVKHSFDIDQFILENIDIFTDGQLTRIRNGEDPLAILAELIRDSMSTPRNRGDTKKK